MKRLLIVIALLFAMPTFADNLDEYILIVVGPAGCWQKRQVQPDSGGEILSSLGLQ